MAALEGDRTPRASEPRPTPDGLGAASRPSPGAEFAIGATWPDGSHVMTPPAGCIYIPSVLDEPAVTRARFSVAVFIATPGTLSAHAAGSRLASFPAGLKQVEVDRLGWMFSYGVPIDSYAEARRVA
jgi:hypothetical protein